MKLENNRQHKSLENLGKGTWTFLIKGIPNL